MRSIWLIFGCLLLVLVGLRFFWPAASPGPVARPTTPAPAVLLASQRAASPRSAPTGLRDSIVHLALRQVGTPYVWAGTSPRTGFDCSGFITYVFSQFGVATPHATALLIGAGQPVPRAQAQPGDIVVFTGTAEGSTTPGHAGIVISALGETPLRFVHASSARRESGVKVSQVENSGYERRFMQVRRVLGGGPATASPVPAATSQATPPRPLARPAGAVAALPTAAPAVATDLAVTLPTRLAPVSVRPRPHARAGASTLKVRTSTPAATKRLTLAKRTAATKAVATPNASKKAVPQKPLVGKASPKKAALKKSAATGQKTTRLVARPKSTTHRAKPKSR